MSSCVKSSVSASRQRHLVERDEHVVDVDVVLDDGLIAEPGEGLGAQRDGLHRRPGCCG